LGHAKGPIEASCCNGSQNCSPSKPSGLSEIKQAPALPPKKNWWRKERRVPITISELELAISEAIKKAAPDCEDFVGVFARHETPKSHLDPNWVFGGKIRQGG
jgi:hypothetical protein